MDDAEHGQCSVVYYCPGGDNDISELFLASTPPLSHPPDRQSSSAWERIYNNVRRLLDEDQGGFNLVFVTSHTDKCLERLEAFTKSRPTAVLVELSDATIAEKQSDADTFLRTLAADAQGLRYNHHVMPFLLLATASPPDLHHDPQSASGSDNLGAGAIDTMRSPLCPEAIGQLVGHVKETTRPSAHLLASGMAGSLVLSIANAKKPRIASHRPDKVLSLARKTAVEEAIGRWQFPAHDFDLDELTYGALLMLEHVLENPDLASYRLPRAELMTLLLAARRQYKHEREVHYHNWRHAVDVTQSVYCFLCDIHLCPPASRAPRKERKVNAIELLLSPIDALTLLVSAIGHDVGHPGVNNAFLVACNHQLAYLYNDKSVLENYHCAAYSQLLRQHWPSLGNITHFRSTMICTILATDMQRHFEYMGHLGELKKKVDKSDPELKDWNDKDKDQARELMLALLIKAADISNVARPFEISAQWAKILMKEFSRQAELENELQIPTCLFGGPPKKEDVLAAAQSQKGFMNLFGYPLFSGISQVMPNVSCTLPELEKNREIWEKTITREKAQREAHGDERQSPRTYGSVTEAEVEEARLRKRESEPAAVPLTVPQSPSSPVKHQPGIDSKGSPVKHPASEQRNHMQLGIPTNHPGEKRASSPLLLSSGIPQSPTGGGSSRRSSKDVALSQLQELGVRAQQNFGPAGSRRGSADASWQIHQNHPDSRRGSKDESLTTILVTSQGSPSSRSVPESPKTAKSKQSSNPARASVPSSRSQATDSATTTTADKQSYSTHTSGVQSLEEDATSSLEQHQAGSDPAITHTRDWLGDTDGAHHSSVFAATPNQYPNSQLAKKSSTSSHVMTRVTSGDSAVSPVEAGRKSDSQIRQSRSRSRLRGLKFWKKRKEGPGMDMTTAGSSSP